jgi:hypothetical protein
VAQQEVPGRRTGIPNDELNRADCGYGHPGGDFSAGIIGEVISKEQT